MPARPSGSAQLGDERSIPADAHLDGTAETTAEAVVLPGDGLTSRVALTSLTDTTITILQLPDPSAHPGRCG